jgi:hypothetical protein
MSATSRANTRSPDSVEAAAMPADEVARAELRQANAAYLAGYERRLAEEIAAMLPDREEARRVLAIVDAILSLELPPSEPAP